MPLNLQLFPRYLLNLGFYKGLIYFLRVELLNKTKFKIPGYKNIFFLRPSTTDKKVFREIFLFGEYEFPTSVAPVTILDAGANIGLSSIFFAQRFPNARVYAIEPETSNFEMLRRNTESFSNIVPIHTALWHNDAMVVIRDKQEHHWAFEVEESGMNNTEAFPATSITSLMKKFGIEIVDLLKVDIEGAELELFSQNYEYWLSRTRLLVIEFHDWRKPGCSASVFNAVSKYKIKTNIHKGMLVMEINP